MDIRERQELKQKFDRCYRDKILPRLEVFEAYRQSLLEIKYTTYFHNLLSHRNFVKIFCTNYEDLFACPEKVENEIKYRELLKSACMEDLLESFGFIEPGACMNLSSNYESVRRFFSPQKIDDAYHGCYKNVNFNIVEGYDVLNDDGKIVKYDNRLVLNIEFNKITASEVFIESKNKSIDLFVLLVVFLLFVVALLGNILVISHIFTGLVFPTWIEWFKSLMCCIFLDSLCLGMLFCNCEKNLSKVSLEHLFFNKKFSVKAENQVDARYIMTPAFMERLYNLKTLYNSDKIWVNFKNGMITIAIKTDKDLFEIGDLYTPANDTKQVEQFFNEIMAITDIIDHFKLYEKTGL